MVIAAVAAAAGRVFAGQHGPRLHVDINNYYHYYELIIHLYDYY